MFKRTFNRWLDHLSPRTFAILINFWPPFLGAGVRVQRISPDYMQVDVKLKFHWWNSNYVGTQFGGSIFSMTDAFCAVILLRNLGREFIVWDKAASIDFIKASKSDLHAHFEFTSEELDEIRRLATEKEKYVFDREIEVKNEAGELCARVIKTLYVRKK